MTCFRAVHSNFLTCVIPNQRSVYCTSNEFEISATWWQTKTSTVISKLCILKKHWEAYHIRQENRKKKISFRCEKNKNETGKPKCPYQHLRMHRSCWCYLSVFWIFSVAFHIFNIIFFSETCNVRRLTATRIENTTNQTEETRWNEKKKNSRRKLYICSQLQHITKNCHTTEELFRLLIIEH